MYPRSLFFEMRLMIRQRLHFPDVGSIYNFYPVNQSGETASTASNTKMATPSMVPEEDRWPDRDVHLDIPESSFTSGSSDGDLGNHLNKVSSRLGSLIKSSNMMMEWDSSRKTTIPGHNSFRSHLHLCRIVLLTLPGH